MLLPEFQADIQILAINITGQDKFCTFRDLGIMILISIALQLDSYHMSHFRFKEVLGPISITDPTSHLCSMFQQLSTYKLYPVYH